MFFAICMQLQFFFATVHSWCLISGHVLHKTAWVLHPVRKDWMRTRFIMVSGILQN